jgi:hypothetical protein
VIDKFEQFREEANHIFPHLSHAERDEVARHMAETHVGIHDMSEPPQKDSTAPVLVTRHMESKEISSNPLWFQFAIIVLLLAILFTCALKGHAEPDSIYLNVMRHSFGLPQETVAPSLFKFDASSNLDVNCIAGCSAGASFADNAAFTAGTTPIGITGGWYSTSPTNCTTGSACAPQLTIDRKLFVNAFQGTSPWVVSLASTTITGTVAVTQSTSPWVVSCTAANCAINHTQTSGTTLGALTTYGSSPGAVNVESVNAFITNTPAVTLTSTTITGTVAVTESGTWTNRIVGNAGASLDQANGSAVPTNGLQVGGGSVAGGTTFEVNTVKAASTAAAATDTSLVVQPLVGSHVMNTAAAGTQLVGIVGNAAATLDGAIGGAAPTNALWDTPNPSTASAAALTPFANAALTTSVNVKATAGNVYGLFVVNGAASVCWVQFINSSGAGTLGTGAIFSVPLPASGVVSISPGTMALANFTTGIAVGISTLNNGSVACGTPGSVDVFYK